MDHETVEGFSPRTVDKVERLLDILGEIGEHPRLDGHRLLSVVVTGT